MDDGAGTSVCHVAHPYFIAIHLHDRQGARNSSRGGRVRKSTHVGFELQKRPFWGSPLGGGRSVTPPAAPSQSAGVGRRLPWCARGSGGVGSAGAGGTGWRGV